ncbi:MAG: 50S ribosomal protein L18 [archaeon]|nr:50S ribosomal protein L18 [archaeon]
MSDGPNYKVKFRRRRDFKTNYTKRLALLKSGKARLVVRKTNAGMVCEVTEYKPLGDMVKAFQSASSLKKLGWKANTGNIPSAYLCGYACAKKALKAGVTEAVLDIGLATPIHGGRIFAALKGAIDAGLSVPADAAVFPKEDRANGKHIGIETAKNLEEAKKTIDKEFG